MALGNQNTNTYFTQFLKVASNGNVEMLEYLAGNLYGKVKLLCTKCKDEKVFEANLFANAAVPYGLEEFVKKHRHDPIVIKAKPTDNWTPGIPYPGKIIPMKHIEDIKPLPPVSKTASALQLEQQIMENKLKIMMATLEAMGMKHEVVQSIVNNGKIEEDVKPVEKAPETPKGRRFRE